MIQHVLDFALAVAGLLAETRYRVKVPVAPDKDDALVLALMPEEIADCALNAPRLQFVFQAFAVRDAVAQLVKREQRVGTALGRGEVLAALERGVARYFADKGRKARRARPWSTALRPAPYLLPTRNILYP